MHTGVLTFHRALNYGAVLQAFALKSKLSDLGADAEVIDYKNEVIEKAYEYPKFSKQNGIKNKIKYLLQSSNEKKMRDNFEAFRVQNLLGKDSKSYNSTNICNAAVEYDRVFVGSDQVWNPYGTCSDTTYLLDFLRPGQKYSYAASFGIAELPKQYKDDYAELLQNFGICSVREPQGKKIVENLGLKAQVNIDPVYLLSKEEWNRAFGLEKEAAERYALIYSFNVTPKQIEMAKACAAHGMKVKFIGNPISNIMGIKCEYIRSAGPVDFLKLFYHAAFVITNSFHGSSFAAIFNHPVAIEYNGNNVNSRLENLITMFNIEDRVLAANTNCTNLLNAEIDWNKINSKIEDQKNLSTRYLEECLQ